MIRFSFALSPRMRAFLELRDSLQCLEKAHQAMQARDWMHAACDLRASMLGDQGRKCVVPEVALLLASMQTHLQQLAQDIPHYQEHIDQTCQFLDAHMQALHTGFSEVSHFFAQDALLNAYLNTQKKQDWLGHKLGLTQSLDTLWHGAEERVSWLHHELRPLKDAVIDLDRMLNDYVQWEQRTAIGGSAQITPERGTTHGLLIVGLPVSSVEQGIIPDVSGNKLAIRLRFQRWQSGEKPQEVTDDQPYSMMLIPVA